MILIIFIFHAAHNKCHTFAVLFLAVRTKITLYSIIVSGIAASLAFKQADYIITPVQQSGAEDTAGFVHTDRKVRTAVYTASSDFVNFCDSTYAALVSNNPGEQLPSAKIFRYAVNGYAALLHRSLIQKPGLLTIIDYSLSANKKRLWVIDLKSRHIVFHELVAHGRNSGLEYARYFSNSSESYKSSIGFFVTGDIYTGKHDISLRLHGMEKPYNGKALDRGIVIHGADYVSTDFIRQNQRLGRSQGCPAVSQAVAGPLTELIKDGSCIFSYYPQKSYLKYSRLLHQNIPFILP